MMNLEVLNKGIALLNFFIMYSTDC